MTAPVRSLEQEPHAWNAAAAGYDGFATEVTRPFAEDAARLVRLSPATRVLDVAAGTGAFTMAAAARGAPVLATDFALDMLHALARKCRAAGHDAVTTAVMDGQALAVPDGSMDVAASLFGLMFFPDHDRGIAELRRVLAPGGRAVVATWAPPPRGEMFQLLGAAARAVLPEAPAPAAPPHWAALGDADALVGRLRAAGFAHAHAVTTTHLWTFDDPEALVERLPAMAPPAAALFAGLSAEQRATFARVFAGDLRRRQGDGPYAVSYEGIVAVATAAR